MKHEAIANAILFHQDLLVDDSIQWKMVHVKPIADRAKKSHGPGAQKVPYLIFWLTSGKQKDNTDRSQRSGELTIGGQIEPNIPAQLSRYQPEG